MEKYTCVNCGAPINMSTCKCEYRGTQYEKYHSGDFVHYIQTCPAQIMPLRCEMSISEEALRSGDVQRISEFAVKNLSRSLAEELEKYMKIETRSDPYRMCQIIRGTVRVVEPDFRF